ncbi:MAG: hypothetical protein MUO34_04880 [Ignavibacteriaceae bacterium]|nr:hypothetical protein [Ignavibacteriaceae bacterium]
MKKNENILSQEKDQILNFLKTRFPLFHNSNFFFRDLQYGIRSYFEKKGIKITYPQAEKYAYVFANQLETEKVFVKVNQQSWKVNYPEFATAQPGDPFHF